MLRQRDRVEASRSEVHTCGCGGRISVSGVFPDLTVIHSHPWCPPFEAALRQMQQDDPNATLHKAVILPESGETVVVADGDRVEDVDH